jgi:hypothetical protein
MNFLPIIILLFLFFKKDSVSSILNGVNIDEIKETLKSLGIKNDLLNGVSNELVNEVLSGNFKAILPILPTLLSAFKNNSTANFSDTSYETAEELNPIKDIAGEKITSTLGDYFK